MHILNVNVLLDPVTGGGTAERTVQLSQAMANAGVKCTILTTDMNLTTERINSLPGVNVQALPCLNKRFYLPNFLSGAIDNLVGKADVVHLMNHWNMLNALVYLSIRKHKKPYVVCPAGALPIFGRSRIFKTIYNKIIGKKIIRNADRFIAITDSEVPEYLEYGGVMEKVAVIPNGINKEEFKVKSNKEFRDKFNLPDKQIILFVGRLNPIKGPDLLLKAFLELKEELDDHHLVFAGPDGGMRKELEKLVAEQNAHEMVSFIGYIDGMEKSKAYHAACLLVIPSRQEAMSIVAIEAGICGTPVLLTDQCGFDLVNEIGGGLVVPASQEGLVGGLQELLAKGKGLSDLGANLKLYVGNHFTWEKIVQDFISLYNQLLSSKTIS